MASNQRLPTCTSPLEFIPFGGPNDASKKEKRRTVRSLVMRNFHRDRKAQARLHLDSVNHARQREEPQSMHSCRESTGWRIAPKQRGDDHAVNDQDGYERKIVTSQDFTLRVSRLNWDLAQLHQAHPLILQHVGYIELGCMKLSSDKMRSPLIKYWLPASRARPALYYASLFVSSASVETLSQQSLSPTSYMNRGRAITLINAELSDPLLWTSDELVAAILSLANFECVCGNATALAYHVSGVMELVRLRGGCEKLGMEGLLSKLISLYSWFLQVFTVYGSCPPASLQDSVEPIPPTCSQLFCLSYDRGIVAEECQPFVKTLQNLYRRLMGIGQSYLPSYSEYSSFLDLETSLRSHQWHNVYKCCVIASEIWDMDGQRPLRTACYLRQVLKSSLEDTNFIEDWASVPGALLWCLLVGVDDSYMDPSLYPWFTSQLLRVWTPLCLYRWTELRRVLDWFRWLFKQRKANRFVSPGMSLT